MSKIGKQPIKIPDNIKVRIEDDTIFVADSSGREASVTVLYGIKTEITNDEIQFTLGKNDKRARSNWGTLRSLVKNAIQGLIEDFEKNLILEGVGYKIKKEGKELIMSLGFSHLVYYSEPEGIEFEVGGKGTTLKIKGADKQLVGHTAAVIRKLKKVEPYKGKGFRYSGEIVRRKAGKKAVATST